MNKLLSTLLFALFVTLSLPALADDTPFSRDISISELKAAIADNNAPTIVDVRTESEFQKGHVTGALNIPLANIQSLIDMFEDEKDEPIVLYCRSGKRAGMAAEQLKAAGFTQLIHLEGDYNGWQQASSH